jgi:NAD(P)-dependent dehydrogenase (short-subunit alcohol dehydrogenase family)
METAGSRFTGKTAIVTGAGSGIGRATAVRLARESAGVVATDVVPGRLEALAGELAGCDVVTVAGDVTSHDLPQRLVDAAGRSVDVLANVAGIVDGFLPAAEVDDETWERVLGVNLTAPLRLMRAVLPGMIAAGAGSIVNVASVASVRGGAAGAAYTASKHGLVGLTTNTAFMYAPKGIRVNAVAPGAVRTNIEGTFRSEWARERLRTIHRIVPPAATPEELAAVVCWLASDDAANVTGAVVAADGGWSAT